LESGIACLEQQIEIGRDEARHPRRVARKLQHRAVRRQVHVGGWTECAGDRSPDLRNREFSFQDGKDAIGGHEASDAGDVLLAFRGRDEATRRTVGRHVQILDDEVSQAVKVGQARLGSGNSRTAKEDDLTVVAGSQEVVG
jgi:hypothetical protein